MKSLCGIETISYMKISYMKYLIYESLCGIETISYMKISYMKYLIYEIFIWN